MQMSTPMSLSALLFIQQITVELSSGFLVIWGQCSQQDQKPTDPGPRHPPSPAHRHSLCRLPLARGGVSRGSCAERRSDPRPLDGARARTIAQSQRSPGAHRSLQPASGSRQAPPKSRTFAYQTRTVCGIFFSRGVLVSQSENQGVKGRSEALPESPSSGRSLPSASLPGRWPCVCLAQSQS